MCGSRGTGRGGRSWNDMSGSPVTGSSLRTEGWCGSRGTGCGVHASATTGSKDTGVRTDPATTSTRGGRASAAQGWIMNESSASPSQPEASPEIDRRRFIRAAALVLAGLAVLAKSAPAGAQVPSPAPPPPLPVPQAESVPSAPGPEYVWTPGHWAWRPWLGRYVWIPGFYHVPVYPSYVWVPGHWGWGPILGYHWIEGHWRIR